MNKIPTAEEFFENNHGLYTAYSVRDIDNKLVKVVSIDKAIEFTKLHVKAALEAALEDCPHGSSTDIPSYEDMRNLILNAYPDELIK